MKKIPLCGVHGKGKYALVDDEDYNQVKQYRWHLAAGYIKTSLKGRRKNRHVTLHDVILWKPKGKKLVTDHINGNCLDNRRKNLRICTNTENCRNTKIGKNNTSGFKGVSWAAERGAWLVQIMVNRKKIWLGYFDNKVDAAKAYDKAAIKAFGDFAWLNFPKSSKRSAKEILGESS